MDEGLEFRVRSLKYEMEAELLEGFIRDCRVEKPECSGPPRFRDHVSGIRVCG